MTDFDFSDINLDFLQTTPPRNGVPLEDNQRVPTPYMKPELDLGSRSLAKKRVKSKKLSEWAKKVARADELLMQIKKLECDKLELQGQLKDLQQSAVTIQNLYTNEKVASDQKSRDIKRLQEQFEKADSDLTIKNLKCDQLEGQLALNKDRPVEYNELVVKYLRLLNKVDEDIFSRNCSERIFNENLRQYCNKYKLKVPPPTSPKQSKSKKLQAKEHMGIQCDLFPQKQPNENIGIQCDLIKDHPQEAEEKPVMKTQSTQCITEVRNQGCQHISTMTTRATTTACFIKYRSVGTNCSPEQQPQQQLMPVVDEILREFAPWQNIKPISPLIDQPVNKANKSIQSTQKSVKSIGTCTWLCNIRRPIDFMPNKRIQRLNTSRSTITTCDCPQSQSIKEEIMTPSVSPIPNVQTTTTTATQNAASNPSAHPANVINSNPLFNNLQTSLPLRQLSEISFDSLWQIFGRMLWGLLQTSNAGIASNQNASIHNPEAVNQHHFNSWLRELYENSAPASNATAETEGQRNEEQTSHNVATSPINLPTSDEAEVIAVNNETMNIPNVANSPLHFNSQSPPFGSPHVVRPQPRRSNGSEEFRINQGAENENTSGSVNVSTYTDNTKENLNLLKNSKDKNKKQKILNKIQELFPDNKLSKSKKKALKRLLKESKKGQTKKKKLNFSKNKDESMALHNKADEETAIDFLNDIFDSSDEISQNPNEITLSPTIKNIKIVQTTLQDKDNFKKPQNVAACPSKTQLHIHNNKNTLYTTLFGGDSDIEEDEDQELESIEVNSNPNDLHAELSNNNEILSLEQIDLNLSLPENISIPELPTPLLRDAELSIQKNDPPINLLSFQQMDVETQNRFDSIIDQQLSEFPKNQMDDKIIGNCGLDKDFTMSSEEEQEEDQENDNLNVAKPLTIENYNENIRKETFKAFVNKDDEASSKVVDKEDVGNNDSEEILENVPKNINSKEDNEIFLNKTTLKENNKKVNENIISNITFTKSFSLDEKEDLKQSESELSQINESSSKTFSNNEISIIEISSDNTSLEKSTNDFFRKIIKNNKEIEFSTTESNGLNNTQTQSLINAVHDSVKDIPFKTSECNKSSSSSSDYEISIINLISDNTILDNDEIRNSSSITPTDELVIDIDTEEEDHNEKLSLSNISTNDLPELEMYNHNNTHEISSLLNSSECRDILSDSILPLVNEVLRDDQVIIEKTPLRMDKKPQGVRGRKRKSECQSEEQIPCKRSERLRARNRTNGLMEVKGKQNFNCNTIYPLAKTPPSCQDYVDGTIDLNGKQIFNANENYTIRKSLTIENNKNPCDEYLKSPLSPSPPPANQEPPLDDQILNSTASLSTNKTNEFFDSPLSPSPPAQQDPLETLLNNKTIEIPLKLSTQYIPKNQSLSLVENLMHYYSPIHFNRIVTANSNQITETKTKEKENHILIQYEKVLKEYCNSTIQLDPDIMANNVFKTLKQFNSIDYSLLCQGILKIAKTSEASTFKDSEMPSIIQEMPPRHCNQTLHRLYYLLKLLNANNPNFSMDILLKIDNFLFNIQQSEKITLNCSVHLVQLYLMGCKLQEHTFQQNPGRFLIAKCLYFHALKSIAMVNEVLMWYPTVLPPKEDRSYDRSDALITVIQQLLMGTKYDMENSDLRGRQLLSKLRFEYHYQPFKPSLDETITNLMEKLKMGKFCNLSFAFALLCKRMAPARTINLLDTQLMPLANEYFNMALTSPHNDEHISQILDIISKIIKPLPTDVNVDSYLNLFSRFLNNLNRPPIQEAAVCSIIRLQRFGYVNCFHRLMGFKPTFELTATAQAMLKTFIHRKPLGYLKAIAKQGHVNLG